MDQRRFKSLRVVPAFVEGLEDVDQLLLLQPVQVGDDGVQLVDVVLLLVFRTSKRPWPWMSPALNSITTANTCWEPAMRRRRRIFLPNR